uniref:Predicted protein n=1 Tax=Hordeum vulgare subsp. vulgare TaxID=112509 RepID=F2EDI8_HORVV|nr:predicted protein [Hordeum vulgare subsp. vulgare]
MATARVTAAFFSVAVMLLFVSIGAHAGGQGDELKVVDIVVETCKNASSSCRNRHLNVTQEFCVQTLRSDKRSSGAKDLLDLSLIAVDILKIRVAAAGGKVKEALQKAKKGSEEALGLRYCQVDYDVAVRTLGLCDAMLRDFHVPRGEDEDGPWPFELPDCVETVTGHVSDCWGQLPLENYALIKESQELNKLGDLNNALLGPYDVNS